MKKDALSDRMKENYEKRARTYLTRRTPVILRLDGKAFHTFTKGFERPYDKVFHEAMNETMMYLCKNIQGCKLGYTQSDEITLLLTDYDTLTTDAWFDYAVQKMCSVASSMATMAFNRSFQKAITNWWNANNSSNASVCEQYQRYVNAYEKGAMFDCRCFNIPVNEVANCFVWRQQDATRNAIQMLGQTYFSHKQLDKKSTSDIQDMLMLEKGINFNDMPIEFKRGVCCVKVVEQDENVDIKDGYCPKSKWVLDKEIPIFSKDFNYIEKFCIFS